MDNKLALKTPEIENTDGLPLPQRIWAIVAISFALHVGTRYKHCQYRTPHPFT